VFCCLLSVMHTRRRRRNPTLHPPELTHSPTHPLTPFSCKIHTPFVRFALHCMPCLACPSVVRPACRRLRWKCPSPTPNHWQWSIVNTYVCTRDRPAPSHLHMERPVQALLVRVKTGPQCSLPFRRNWHHVYEFKYIITNQVYSMVYLTPTMYRLNGLWR